MRKVVALLVFGLIINSFALDIELASEGGCENIPAFKGLKPMSLDPIWVSNSSVQIYIPFVSYYELYRLAEDLYHRKAEDITDQELNNLCHTYVMEVGPTGMTMELIGPGGLSTTYEFSVGKIGEMLWRLKGDAEYLERSFVTKIGPDYFVAVTCWNSGQRSWSFNKRGTNTITDEEKRDVIEHIKPFGFEDPKFYLHYHYERCGKKIQNNFCMRNCLVK